MNREKGILRAWAAAAIVITAATGVTGCGGGAGEGGGGGGGPVVMAISVEGIGAPIFAGGQAQQPNCPVGSFLNATVSITFGGAVDPSSLPPDGAAAAGSIQIVDQSAAIPAFGRFTIAPGRPDVVLFTAMPPPDPAQGCQAGLRPGAAYTVFIPDASFAASQVISIEGRPLLTAVSTCFRVVTCPGGVPFVDTKPGPPAVTATSPSMDGTAPIVARAQLEPVSGQPLLTIDVDEALDPITVTATSVLLLNISANPTRELQAGGQVTFAQLGTIANAPDIARITFAPFGSLPDADVFEVRFAGVRDLGGNALTSVPGSLLFTLEDESDDVMVTFTDGFDDTSNRQATNDTIDWSGDGAVRARFPESILGNGGDGAGIFLAPMTINTDTQLTPGDADAIPGVFNFTDVDVQASTVFRSTTANAQPSESNWPVLIRSTGTVSIGAPGGGTVTIDCAGRTGDAALGSISALTINRFGGHGGPGAGAGGIASPNSAGSSPAGNPGEGGHVDLGDRSRVGGAVNVDPTSPFFGGGGGGRIGLAANSGVGGSGGGGGAASSFAGYGPGDPASFSFRNATSGEPHSGANAPAPGLAGPLPAAMLVPLLDAVGGSGGGAGGDLFSSATTQRAAGAGGGGGGAIGISALNGITLLDGSRFRCSGGHGGDSPTFFTGRGAGGSGGSIRLRTFGQVVLQPGVVFDCAGGLGNGGTSASGGLNGEGGDGGDGVVDIEDLDGAGAAEIALAAPGVEGELRFAALMIGAGGLQGRAESVLIDTGSTSVDYLGASSSVDPGDVPGASVTVRVIGVAEDPASPGQPATAAISPAGFPLMAGPVDLADIGTLDGFRWFGFVVETTFPGPPVGTAASVLPSADAITVTYLADLGP